MKNEPKFVLAALAAVVLSAGVMVASADAQTLHQDIREIRDLMVREAHEASMARSHAMIRAMQADIDAIRAREARAAAEFQALCLAQCSIDKALGLIPAAGPRRPIR